MIYEILRNYAPPTLHPADFTCCELIFRFCDHFYDIFWDRFCDKKMADFWDKN